MLRLLGPVEVAGAPSPAGDSPRQRLLLAALATDADRPVPVEVLVDRVWGTNPPPRARRTLHAYIARARRMLADAAGDAEPMRIDGRSGTYLLRVDPQRVDLHRFRLLVGQARDTGCPPPRRVVLLREAMGLWRGPPLAGLSGAWPTRMRESWQHERVDATVAWAQAELVAGDPAAAVHPVAALVGDHPLAESLTAALIRLLARTGRTADALRCYEDIRHRLAEELGMDPGQELRQAHQAVLRGESTEPEGARPTRTPSARTVEPVPAQLPLNLAVFTGRHRELAALDALLAPAPGPGTTALAVLSGTAGIGKTALAVHWGHRVRDRFPDGQLYVNLRGFDPSGPPVDPAAAIRGFLDAFAVPARQVPVDPDAQTALYRSLLADRQVLVVLDNARDAQHVRPLLPAAPGCFVVVTSRNHLGGLVAAEGARLLVVDLLTGQEAEHLLISRLGAGRVEAEPRAVDEIVALSGRLPLALAIIAVRAAVHPGSPLTRVTAELRQRHRLDALDAGDPAVDLRGVFALSYDALTPGARRLFRLLGLHPGPDVTSPAAASLIALSHRDTHRLLHELAQANLITEPAPGRYAFHDLLRAYAADLTHRLDADDDRTAATHRLLDHYLHTAYHAERLLLPAREQITLTAPRPGVTVTGLTSFEQALTWFTAEHAVLLAATHHAVAREFHAHAWQLSWTLANFLESNGFPHDFAAVSRVAVVATHRLDDPWAEVRAYLLRGHSCTLLGRFDDARTHLRHAIELCGRTGDRLGEAHARWDIAKLLERQGRHGEALDHVRQAHELYRSAGNRLGQATTLNGIGWLHAQLGDYESALAACEHALRLLQQGDDRNRQASTYDSLGYIHHQLHHHATAVTCYQRALDGFRDTGAREDEAITLTRLGHTHYAAGDPGAAQHVWQRALRLLTDLGHPDAAHVRTRLASLTAPPDSQRSP
ncbi:tetratricopeptide repeat protein [Lentzea sp. NPDC059081]|uniref:AfsR/SARP family transcriptional regulator n=1 Tax=Lentzea sp. NPDC059081 TaxID=3346719 RepID=UPI0036B27CC7